MSVATYRTVMCDRCTEESDAMRTSFEVRAMARRYGWSRRRVDGAYVDLCPECSAGAAPAHPESETPLPRGGDE